MMMGALYGRTTTTTLLLVLLVVSSAHSFYLPGVAPRDFQTVRLPHLLKLSSVYFIDPALILTLHTLLLIYGFLYSLCFVASWVFSALSETVLDLGFSV
jgi:hypothetical protein